MDEFDMFRARAYGGMAEIQVNDVTAEPEMDLNNMNRTSSSRSGSRRRSVRKGSDRHHHDLDTNENHEDPVDRRSGEYAAPQHGGFGGSGHLQVTVAVQPPSPTETRKDMSGTSCQRSQSWKTKQLEGNHELEVNGMEGGHLHRTRTMPANRSPSSRRGSRTPLTPNTISVTIDPPCLTETPGTLDARMNGDQRDEDEEEEGGSRHSAPEECRIYRVRSFTTRKGGIVNRGDSIKVCTGSSFLAPSSGGNLSRRNSTASVSHRSGVSAEDNLRLGVQAFSSARRSSFTCLNAAPKIDDNLNRHRRGSSEQHYRRGSSDQRQQPELIELIPGRRGSIRRRVQGEDEPQDQGIELAILNQNGDMVWREVNTEAENVGEGDDDGEEHLVYKVVVLGSQGVGKSTLINQLLTSEYLANKDTEMQGDEDGEQIVSVVLDDVESTVNFVEGEGLDHELLQSGDDFGENSSNPPIDACLLIYSVTDRSSFAFIQTCLQDLTKHKQQLQQQRRRNHTPGDRCTPVPVVLVVGNKQDLVRNRVVSETEGKRLASKRHCKCIEASALLDHRVDEVLVSIIRQIRQQKSSGENNGNVVADSDDDLTTKGCIQKAAIGLCRKLFK